MFNSQLKTNCMVSITIATGHTQTADYWADFQQEENK